MKAKELQEITATDGTVWKVGDKVLLTRCGLAGEAICPITRITDGRGGTIYVGDGNLATGEPYEIPFDLKGNKRASNDWSTTGIQLATDEDYTRIRRKRMRNRIANVAWGSLPLEVAEKVYNALLTVEELKVLLIGK